MTRTTDASVRRSLEQEMVTVRVECASAQAVYVLGAFNRWSTTATPMRQVTGGAWEIGLAAADATSQLAFLIWYPGERTGRLLSAWSELSGGVPWTTRAGTSPATVARQRGAGGDLRVPVRGDLGVSAEHPA